MSISGGSDTDLIPLEGSSQGRRRVVVPIVLFAALSLVVAATSWLRGGGEERLVSVAADQTNQTSDLVTTSNSSDTAAADGETTTSVGPSTSEFGDSTPDTQSPGVPADQSGPTLKTFTTSVPLSFDENAISGVMQPGSSRAFAGIRFQFEFSLQDPSYAQAGDDALRVQASRQAGFQHCLTHLSSFVPGGIATRQGERFYYGECVISTGLTPGAYPVLVTASDSLGNTWERQVATITFKGEAWRDADGPALAQPLSVQAQATIAETFVVQFRLTDFVGVNVERLWFTMRSDTYTWHCTTVLIAGTSSNGTYGASCGSFGLIPGTYGLFLEVEDLLGQDLLNEADFPIRVGTITWVNPY